MTHIIDGRALAQDLCTQVSQKVNQLSSQPCLALVYVGQDPATEIYVSRKQEMARKVGMKSKILHFDEGASFNQIQATLDVLNRDAEVHGILLQLPLPSHLDRFALLETLDPRKDVDGLTSQNLGLLAAGRPRFVPCTPQGCLRIMDHVGYDLAGKSALMLGRSAIVGLPLSLLLTQRNATVTVAHSHTQNVEQLISQADVVVAAIGKPGFVQHVKAGAFVLDVGINRLVKDGSATLVGDVDAQAIRSIAGYLTPVPGGVGPMTVACLMANTLKAWEIS